MSLYQIVQEFDDSSLLLSPSTLEQLVGSLLDLLLEQKLTTTLWVKPATTWITHLDNYLHHGKLDKVYWCQTFTGSGSKNPLLIPVKLETTADLEREFFLVVISENFSLSILAQQQPISTMPTKLTRRASVLQFKVSCHVELEVISRILQGVKEVCDVDDSNYEYLPSDLSLPSVNGINANLLLKLLLKQFETIENLGIDSTISGHGKHQSGLHSQSLLLQEHFIDQLSRELRPPLTNMKTAICLLESKYIKIAQRQRYLQLLHKEWERQNDLLTGLLELVQLDHLSSRELSISASITETLPGLISIYQPIAKEKKIQLSYQIAPNLPLIYCSNLWLKQIILNLLNNSLKFTNEGGEVSVDAVVTSRGVELSFIDTGIGINPSEISKIFDSFYRGHNSLGEQNRGAGLGLSIVKQLLERCDGSITVSSQVNKGSVFRAIFKIAS